MEGTALTLVPTFGVCAEVAGGREACKALGGSGGAVHSTISLAAICIRAVAKHWCHSAFPGFVRTVIWW